MSGDNLQDAAAQDAAIDQFYAENPVGSADYKAKASELRALMEQRHGTAPAEGAPIGEVQSGQHGPIEAAPVEEVPAVEPGTAEAFAENLHALGPEGSAIVSEWGGDLGRNAGYLRHAVEHVARDDPGIVELLNSEVEDEHGKVTRLGNHPGLIKAAALFGRLLAHRNGLEVEALRSSARKSARSEGAGGGNSMDGLTEQIFAAMGRGDRIAANRLQVQRDALAKRLYGTAPADGRL